MCLKIDCKEFEEPKLPIVLVYHCPSLKKEVTITIDSGLSLFIPRGMTSNLGYINFLIVCEECGDKHILQLEEWPK